MDGEPERFLSLPTEAGEEGEEDNEEKGVVVM